MIPASLLRELERFYQGRRGTVLIFRKRGGAVDFWRILDYRVARGERHRNRGTWGRG